MRSIRHIILYLSEQKQIPLTAGKLPLITLYSLTARRPMDRDEMSVI